MVSIPEFPKFGPIPLDAKAEIDALMYGSGLTSDSHASLWSWAGPRRIRCSALNGNLILQFENGLTGQREYTFLGRRRPADTVHRLMEECEREGIECRLNLVPAGAAEHLPAENWVIERDDAYADYLLDTHAVSTLRGRALKRRRHGQNQFQRATNFSVDPLTLSDRRVAADILRLTDQWAIGMDQSVEMAQTSIWGNYRDEMEALKRLLSAASVLPVFGIGIRVSGKLVGIQIAELREGYGILHFAKADTTEFPGAQVAGMSAVATALKDQSITILNYQEDLGNEGLRQAKRSYNPIGHFARCTVRSACTESLFYVGNTLKTGRGLFTRQSFKRGSMVFRMTGERRHYISRTAEDAHRYENWLSVGPDLFIDPAEPYVFVNHSCEPNLGIHGDMEFVALRDIEAGTELTYDYSITTPERCWTMQCLCGSKVCRQIIRSIQYLPERILASYAPYVTAYMMDEYAKRDESLLLSQLG